VICPTPLYCIYIVCLSSALLCLRSLFLLLLYCIYVICLPPLYSFFPPFALLHLRNLSSSALLFLSSALLYPLRSTVSPPLYCIYIVCLPSALLFLHSLSSRSLFFFSAIVFSTDSFFSSTILHLLSLSFLQLCCTYMDLVSSYTLL
jgi:hypothetical protein